MGSLDESTHGANGEEEKGDQAQVGNGPLGAEGVVVEAGKGKFGMALEYVSFPS